MNSPQKSPDRRGTNKLMDDAPVVGIACGPRLPDTGRLYKEMSAGMPNYVTCEKCGRRETVNPAECLRRGWPLCHGAMTLGARHLDEASRQEPRQ